MLPAFWYSEAFICPRPRGFDVALTKDKWVHRQTLRQAKWIATVYKNLGFVTFQKEFNASAGKSFS